MYELSKSTDFKDISAGSQAILVYCGNGIEFLCISMFGWLRSRNLRILTGLGFSVLIWVGNLGRTMSHSLD